MRDLSAAIDQVLGGYAAGRRLRVGVLYRGDPEVVARVAAAGHALVVVGERFFPLLGLHARMGEELRARVLFAEARFGAEPLRPLSLDAVVLSRGLPSGERGIEALERLRGFLAPTGLLVWPHPVSEGWASRVARLFHPGRWPRGRVLRRAELSALTMAAGFAGVGQIAARGPLFPWVVTHGRAGRRPW